MIEQSVSLASNGSVQVPGYEHLARFGYTKNRGVYRLAVTASGEWEGLAIRAFWHVPDGKDPASSLVVDGYVVDAQFGFTPEGAGEAGLDDSFIARLKQGSRLTTQINGSEPINWALKGSAAVVTKIEECYTNQGVLP